MNSTVRLILFWCILIGGAILLWKIYDSGRSSREETPNYTELIKKIENEQIKEAVISETEVTGKLKDDKGFRTEIANDQLIADMVQLMQKKNVQVTLRPPTSGFWLSMLSMAFPLLILMAFWIFMMRQMQGNGNKALSFGKSRAKLLSNQSKRVTFKDVAGVEESKDELQE
ncbi:MAG TPA: ATP-dependent metallopeptidase FtsH/Yme1/Tma family protein, partial [Acidobacteriota bacterium]|nr:ATP-dependent metallopeptidase FtsH/Yme1/Tma family protein [Acidobacteriota bacterium]